jgi:methylated-DNA-[protein]-cysteine S-methyltransferase
MTQIAYTVFETAWGYAGFSASPDGVTALHLPMASRQAADRHFHGGVCDARLMTDLQAALVSYFEGQKVDFRVWPRVDLGSLSEFALKVLAQCRQLDYGRTTTYARLAEMAGRPGAARAAGTVLANNPVPLIVPCHRVVRANGSLGGYSGEGGIKTKGRLVNLESHG